MTVIHPTSCTECKDLLIDDCPACEMNKYRISQFYLSTTIALEMILALTLGTRYGVYIGLLGDNMVPVYSLYVANIAGLIVFFGLAIIFLLRNRITNWMFRMAEVYQSHQPSPDDEEDEDD